MVNEVEAGLGRLGWMKAGSGLKVCLDERLEAIEREEIGLG